MYVNFICEVNVFTFFYNCFFFQNPVLVKRGATVATLIAAVFRSECELGGIKLNERGVLQGILLVTNIIDLFLVVFIETITDMWNTGLPINLTVHI